MKLLQLNIWMGRLLPRVLELIDEIKPDILCLQEVFDTVDTIPIPDLMFNSLGHIKAKTGYEHCFLSPVLEMNISGGKALFGNAILSKYPLKGTRTIFINGQFVSNYSSKTRIPNTRNLQYSLVELPGLKKLHLINHHAFWVADPLGNEESVKKMEAVAEFVSGLSGPIITSGDLNVTAQSPAMRPFDGILQDLTATKNIKSTLSILGKVKDVACDHILVNPQINVLDFRVLDTLVSDHQALVLEFEL